MWTVQEVAMAHSVQIVTPTRSYNYDTFMAYLSDWLDRRAHVNPKEYPSASITLSRGWGFPEVLVTMGGDSATDLFTARKELRFWVNWIRAGEPKIEQQQTMDNYLIGYRFTQTEAFCNITAASSSDPKDKVFSVQSLMDTIGVHFPPPDYSLDIGEIYWRACLSILRHDNYLALLRLVNGPHPSKWKSKVPSWVPDFDRTCRRWQMNFKYLRSANTYSCPCLKFTPDERILITNAKIIDKIGGMIYEEVVKVLDYSPTSEFMERYNKSIKAVQRLIIAALSVRPSTVGQMGEKRIDPLTMILFQITPVLIKMNGCGPDHFEQNDFVKLLRLSIYEPEKISQMYKTTVTASKVQNDLLANTDFQASSHLPEFQMLPIILTHGWLKHLNKISNVAVGNALIWTKDSLCGTGPTSVQPGDVVALIPTIKAPMILRPTPRGTFEVIGPAFITGLMNGEKWSEDIDPDNYNGHDLPEIQLE
jgi:hypothetical protein